MIGSNPESENASTQPNNVELKKTAIRKRVADDDDFIEDADDEVFEDVSSKPNNRHIHREDTAYSSQASTSTELGIFKAKAEKELHEFLSKKGVDVATEAKGFKVHVSVVAKSRNRNLNGAGGSKPPFTVNYTSPEGEFLQAKGDVLNSIQKQRHKGNSQSSVRFTSTKPIADIHAAAKANFENTFTENLTLPIEIDGITIFDMGNIEVSNSAFHTMMDIYPIGYRAEVNYVSNSIQTSADTATHFNGDSDKSVICEILDRDGLPEFQLTDKSNNRVFTATSESAVWKKVGFTLNIVSCVLELLKYIKLY